MSPRRTRSLLNGVYLRLASPAKPDDVRGAPTYSGPPWRNPGPHDAPYAPTPRADLAPLFDDSCHDTPLLLGVFVGGAVVGAVLCFLITRLVA